MYNPCLLITKEDSGIFRLVRIQTNNTLILRDPAFVTLKDNKLKKAKLLVKLAKKLSQNTLLIFNGYKLAVNKSGNRISMLQKD